MAAAAALLAAYLLGSTPFAYFAGRALRGIDLRQHGSGNLGATNVYRTLGAAAAIVVLLLDALKGAVPVLAFPSLAQVTGVWWPVAFGVAAIVGHVRPYAGLFKGGGKGVATASGVFAALAPVPFLAAFGTFVVVVAATRYVSLGSMLGAAALATTVVVREGASSPLGLVSVLVAAFVVWTHRANIGRLRRGEESRLGRPGGAAR
ncbi:MAG: glycerol-3-phosphate 1-O-acyltransferase PlsY [Gemmatimonadetes bacterium]|jgi:glycerol-3-phosphate acyltransferase PlsY|nr:glycerol-3-phosphate 1-O-acyltransferase PlsY [Gemmatimonadota bacterium]HNV73536.1 glycerol-3-phosphate 1-O-acyltransferase PlsY [Gemmatimonadaceae bacterium]MBK6842070.1 glycerol-3-phosphate 1-O-acyltransferase PlsY [Gemmatimonadota bacterium]MBK7835775.1 glycerol-3-phosphate 1-O-acyltransferase PlsY [Gemmatimonadota bacterium]MBK8062169.1 glycerol-3-phosphate 1-O-acyltransferase PlsY [Gemmatimonadota bacterium]